MAVMGPAAKRYSGTTPSSGTELHPTHQTASKQDLSITFLFVSKMCPKDQFALGVNTTVQANAREAVWRAHLEVDEL